MELSCKKTMQAEYLNDASDRDKTCVCNVPHDYILFINLCHSHTLSVILLMLPLTRGICEEEKSSSSSSTPNFHFPFLQRCTSKESPARFLLLEDASREGFTLVYAQQQRPRIIFWPANANTPRLSIEREKDDPAGPSMPQRW